MCSGASSAVKRMVKGGTAEMKKIQGQLQEALPLVGFDSDQLYTGTAYASFVASGDVVLVKQSNDKFHAVTKEELKIFKLSY